MLEQYHAFDLATGASIPAARDALRAPLLRQSDTVVYKGKDGGIRDEVRWVTDERANTAQML
jgi:hypothetical protein